MLKNESSWNLVPPPTSCTKGGEKGVLKAPILDQEKGNFIQLLSLASKPTNLLVSSHSESLWVLGQTTSNMDSLDSPRPEPRGSHRLPPYIILCICPWHLHPNDFLSQDSQGGVPKLFRFELSQLWKLITPILNLRLG